MPLMDFDHRNTNETLRELSKHGRRVPRDAGLVYLYELQSISHTFKGFSMEELSVIYEVFPILSFDSKVHFVKEGDQASFVVVILKGSAKSFNSTPEEKIFVGNFEKGDFIGQNLFFESKHGESAKHIYSVETFGFVNNVMLFVSFEQLFLLNNVNPQCGNRMMRLIGEAATQKIYAPTGAFSLPISEPIENKPDIHAALAPFRGKEDSPIADFDDDDIGTLLENSELVRFVRGDKIFSAGHQSRVILLLLSGGMVTRGIHEDTFTTPGDMTGETMFPFIVHKKDTFASKPSVFLSFTSETIYNLNQRHPSVGFKLTKNIIQGTLKKMSVTFVPSTIGFDPEADFSVQGADALQDGGKRKPKMESADLRTMLTEGLQGLLKKGLNAMTGQTRFTSAEVYDYAGKDALVKLGEMFENLACKLRTKERQISEMVLKKDLQKLEVAHGKLEASAGFHRQELQMKDRRIEGLQYKLSQSEDNCKKLNDEILSRDARIQGLCTEIEEGEAKAARRWKQVNDQLVEMQKNTEEKNIEKIWVELLKDQTKKVQMQDDEIREYKLKIKDFECELENLKRGVIRAMNENEMLEMRLSEKEDMIEVDLDDIEDADKTIPLMQEQINWDAEYRNKLRWKLLASSLRARKHKKTMCKQLIIEMRYYRMQMEAGVKYRGMCEELQKKSSELEDTVTQLTKDLTLSNKKAEQLVESLETYKGHVSKTPEFQTLQMKNFTLDIDYKRSIAERKILQMKFEDAKSALPACLEDLDSLGQLSAWLVLYVLEMEATNKASRVIWRSEKVDLVKSSWEILTRRNFLERPAVSLDMDMIVSLLRTRGVEEFEGAKTPIPSLAYNRDNDGLAKLIAPFVNTNNTSRPIFRSQRGKDQFQSIDELEVAPTRFASLKAKIDSISDLGPFRPQKSKMSAGGSQTGARQISHTPLMVYRSEPSLVSSRATKSFDSKAGSSHLPRIPRAQGIGNRD